MRWQKVARFVVAAIGLGCAVTVYALLRPQPVPVEPAAAPLNLIDDTVVSTSSGGELKRLDITTGETIYFLVWKKSKAMADGRSIFEDVQLKFDRAGVPYTVDADEAESAGKAGPTGEEPETVVFRRNVRMTGANGFSVESQEATYHGGEGRIVFPGEMTFTRDRLSGQGVGAELFMEKSVLWLYDEARMAIAPEAGGMPVVATGKRIGLAEMDHYLKVEEGGRLTRENQELTADLMLVHFTETTETVRRIELEGRSGVRRTGGGDRPDMRADRINLDFVPEDGRLAHARLDGSSVLTLRERGDVTRVTGTAMDLFVGADGQTLTRLDVTAPAEVRLPRDGDTPARTIRSSTLLAEGAEPKGLDRAVFGGGVTYQEDRPASAGQAAATRFAKSNSLVLGLGGALNQVTAATFRQGFSVTDGTMTATADEGRYDAKGETLQLRGNDPKRTVRMVDQQVDVKALEIDVDLKQDAFDARGAVVSVLTPSTKPLAKEADPTGLFERGKSITGHADTLNYSSVTSIASYGGRVLLFQEGDAGKAGTVIRAAKVRLDEQKQNLDAEGQVQTEFYIEQAPGTTGPQGAGITTIHGDRLAYKEATRRAEYSGSVTMVSGPEQKLVGDQITIELHLERRALTQLTAVAAPKGEVRATLPDGRQTVGTRLVYTASNDEYVVTGNPTLFISRSASLGGEMCEVITGTDQRFFRTEGTASVRNKGGAVGTVSNRKCSEVIKK